MPIAIAVSLRASPPVSIIVRSVGRPELASALESVLRQDYPWIEAIVVDATGGGHPALPMLPRATGHVVRMVGGARRLSRAQAANVGLLAARGEWLCFLDDDDTYDRHFVSSMVAAAAERRDALVVYGRSRILRADGQVERLFGLPFNRMLMHYGPLFYWSAALIRHEVVDLGCRFDEALDVCEDRDFLAQIARHSDFAFVPVVGFNYRPCLGTSGTAGERRDAANTTRFELLLRAKTCGEGAYHSRRATRLCLRAIAAFRAGDRERSRELFEVLLGEYPDDPNALHGLARIRLEQGLLDGAEALVSRAIEINPAAAEYRLTLATVLEGMGRHQDARREATMAAADPTLRPAVEHLLRRLPAPDAVGAPVGTAADRGTPAATRLACCACGSGKRFKDCCGRLATEEALSNADRAARQAGRWFAQGEAFRAKALIDTLAPADLGNAGASRIAGEICLELLSFEQAYAFLHRSAQLGTSPPAESLLDTCCHLLWLDRARGAARTTVLQLRERIEARAAARSSPTPGPIHVVATFGSVGGSENRAASLYRILSPHGDVRLWSTERPLDPRYRGLPIKVIDPERGAFPNGGTLVLSGHYFDCGDWWREAGFERVVVCVNVDLPEKLVHRLADIEEAGRAARVEFTFPSRRYRDLFGLPGAIEFSLADVPRFVPIAPRRSDAGRLVIGRHSRDHREKHHPNDPSLYRQLAARGHRLRLLGGTLLQPAFAMDPPGSGIDLLPAGSEDARDFLGGLDCFLYRKHPQFFETGGTAILEAMLMALPVVLFREGVGVAELIAHGEDGFLVDTEAAALACIDRLAADAGLRAAVGDAARRKATAVLDDQQARILAYYLGSS